ncbi:hypothetical protein [Wukongibacter baidiensis]
MVGIECYLVSRDAYGATSGWGHEWNIVNIDGKCYHVDLTWNDADNELLPISYDYFNISDEKISEDHS